jgi:hypothetical protein
MKFIGYVAVLLVTAAGLALGLDLLTAPAKKLEANNAKPASEAVRQIPIKKKETANEDGDPNHQLTPIYPAAPGQDLPVKDTPVKAVAKDSPKPAPKAQPETSGTAPARDVDTAAAAPSTQPAAVPAQGVAIHASSPAAPNSCNVQACAAAYRSFRASDCSYQPFSGPRKFCDASQGEPAQASAQSSPAVARNRNQDQRDLQATVRTVRGLPPPDAEYDDDDGDDRGIVVVEPPDGPRYGLQRHWIIERR